MQLPALTDDSDWSAEITEDAVGEMNGRIGVYAPGDRDDLTEVMAPRRARIQQIRRPVQAVGADEWTIVRDFVFQVEILPGDADLTDDQIIRKGLIVRVFDGGKDQWLERFAFPVLNAVNSSHAALRTIQCTSEASPRTWTP